MPALDSVTIAATIITVFDVAVAEGATALGGSQDPDLAFTIYFAWVALPIALFNKAMPAPFSATDAFAGTAFRPDIFAHFVECPAHASLFLFLAASSHASEPGSR
jgi:hypothetical protein